MTQSHLVMLRGANGQTTLLPATDLPRYFRRRRWTRRLKKLGAVAGTAGAIAAGRWGYQNRSMLRGLWKVGKGAVGIARKVG